MKKINVVYVVYLYLFLSCNAFANETLEGIGNILEKYGKSDVAEFISKKSPDNMVTIQVENKLYVKPGRPSMEYISIYSVNNDFKRLGLSVNQAESAIVKYINKKKLESEKKKKEDEVWDEQRVIRAQKQQTVSTKHELKKTISVKKNTLSEKEAIKQLIKQISVEKYPNDSKMQRYVYNKQVQAYNFLIRVEDSEIKKFANRKYPRDYTMQKYVYSKQLAAKKYMKTITDSDIYRFSKSKYPSDYSMQKYVYDKQLSAKHYMSKVTNQNAKIKAVRKYPSDYSMQKYLYDKSAY